MMRDVMDKKLESSRNIDICFFPLNEYINKFSDLTYS